MKIYLDVCCFSRPFDDQTQGRIRIEAEAVLVVLDHIESGEWELVGSDAVLYEILQIPDPLRRYRVEILSGGARKQIEVDDAIAKRAEEIERLGIRGLDAVHVACAESARVPTMKCKKPRNSGAKRFEITDEMS
jgi:hypothetical protein